MKILSYQTVSSIILADFRVERADSFTLFSTNFWDRSVNPDKDYANKFPKIT